MNITNEHDEKLVAFDMELSDFEHETLVKYGLRNITDEALIQFAVVDILTKVVEDSKTSEMASTIQTFCENAAELGCPRSKDVDMWFRELTPESQRVVCCKIKELMDGQ